MSTNTAEFDGGSKLDVVDDSMVKETKRSDAETHTSSTSRRNNADCRTLFNTGHDIKPLRSNHVDVSIWDDFVKRHQKLITVYSHNRTPHTGHQHAGTADVMCFRFANCNFSVSDQVDPQVLSRLGELIQSCNRVNLDEISVSPSSLSHLEYEIEIGEFQSTNDLLLYANIPVEFKCICFAIFAFQILMFMAAIVATAYDADHVIKARTVDLILVRIFIALYLSLHLTNSFSSSLLYAIERTYDR
jgi:hypothetical protein